MLSILGLACDFVGAVVLAVGLFRAPQPLYPGWLRSPVEAASDRAYGTVGAFFLAGGFGLQSLQYFDVALYGTKAEEVAIGVGGLVAGFAAAGAFMVCSIGFTSPA